MEMLHLTLALAACLLASAAGLQRVGQAALAADVGVRRAHTESLCESDRVKRLPGWSGNLPFDLYSGYVTVDAEAGRALFYAFVSSESDPGADPTALWLNGGPGCSSLGGGFFSELGPFYPSRGGRTLSRNTYAWNREANMLFLESPAFTGFSYSNTSADQCTGDKRTAEDVLAFLLAWLERFPQYRNNPFWLAGESYAGHFVPQVSELILTHNELAAPGAEINFQGFMLGNPLSDAAQDSKGALQYWFFHGLISRQAYDGIDGNCDFSLEPVRGAAPAYASASPQSKGCPFAWRLSGRQEECDRYVQQALTEVSGIDLYDVDADVCIPTPQPGRSPARQLALMLRRHPAGIGTRPLIRSTRAGPAGSKAAPTAGTADQGGRRSLLASLLGPARAQPDYDPCMGDAVAAYLNRPEVQRAMHANASGLLPGPWVSCSQTLEWSCQDLIESMLPLYKRLLRSGIKMLVVSGSQDAVVPLVGTRRWLHDLGLPLVRPWREWRSSTGQVGGWTEDFQGVSFATVRGAGHMVPYTQPERAFHLFSSWIRGRPF